MFTAKKLIVRICVGMDPDLHNTVKCSDPDRHFLYIYSKLYKGEFACLETLCFAIAKLVGGAILIQYLLIMSVIVA